MKKLLFVLLAGLMIWPLSIEAKEKKKKEDKTIEWEMPELTGVADVDSFLVCCDALYKRYKSFEEEIPYYTPKKIYDTTTGDSLVYIVDKDNVIRSSDMAWSQYLTAGASGVTLTTDFAIITTSTALATTALPQLGLGAFKYGKYIKIGSKLAIECPKMIAQIFKDFKEQKRKIREYKQNYDEKTGKIVNPEVDASKMEESLGLGEHAVINKSTEELAKELEASASEAENYEEIDPENMEL